MTVEKLIMELEKMPKRARVVVRGYESGVDDVTDVVLTKMELNVHTESYYGDHELLSEYRKAEGGKVVTAVHISAEGSEV